MSDHDISIDEKRVYDARSETETALLATERGLAAVSVSADQIGEFTLLTTAPTTDVAVVGERVALAGDDVVFVEQYRPVIREHCLELVAGIVEDGETYAEAAVRELREETGYVPEDVTLLQEVDCTTGVLRHSRGVVVAEGLESGERELDPNEFLTMTRVPAAEALARAREQPANDATIEGVLLAAADGYL